LPFSIDLKREIIDFNDPSIDIKRQCKLIGLNRSSLYYLPIPESDENLKIMRMIDKQYLKTPFYGSRRMAAWLSKGKFDINRKRVQRLMRIMGLEAIYPKRKTSLPNKEHKIYPYLLEGLNIVRPNQVWSTDITYIPMKKGFMYLVAVMDWFSRYVVSWEISNTMDVDFCISALRKALKKGTPEIFNTDQGSQFTSSSFTNILLNLGINISMDGRGRVFDNIFIERLWRSLKYEDIYLKNYENGNELIEGVGKYFNFFNNKRPHQSLEYKVPKEFFYIQK
jgi:putative transposase